MRFSSTHRKSSHCESSKRLRMNRCCAGEIAPKGWLLRTILLSLMSFLTSGLPSLGQPPGTPPPNQLLQEDQTDNPENLPIRAFMFLSESGNRVMMPSLTWEEFERFLNLDSGVDTARPKYTYQSLEIEGTSDRERAELDIALRFSVEATKGRWVSIPLRMGNFHRLAPPDVSGVGEYFMALSPDESGYLLFVRSDQPAEALLRMRVSARVEASSAASSLAFRLPDIPVRVELNTDDDNGLGEVIGRGDEAITVAAQGNRTRISVESGGGSFFLRWGQLERSTDSVPVLEVESRIGVRWDSPQDQPVATVRMTIKNIRGSIESFQLRLPRGAVVLESPRLGTSGQSIELGAALSDREGEVREVIIPEEERQQRIDLNFDLQLANDNATAASPLVFRVPEIVGSLRHRGDIDISTGGDYRLRWRSTSWLRSELGESRDDSTSGRSYRFRFDRASFALPLWLGEKERQLRMISRSRMTVREKIASIAMDIEINGQTSDGRLRFDDATWQIQSIESETGQILDSFMEDRLRVIELNTDGSDESTLLRVEAQRSIDSGDGTEQFSLPRVVALDDVALVQDATLDLVNTGRTVLVVDLEGSEGISRMTRTAAATGEDSTVTSFRLVTQGTVPRIVGSMIEQPPRVVLASAATIELDGRQLRTTVDWNISSGLDLEGRLPIRIPRLPAFNKAEQNTIDFLPSEETILEDILVDADLSEADLDSDGNWVVTVDDVPAQLEARGEDRFVLRSERLTTGSMAIRWRHVRDLRSSTADGSIEPVSLPRPDFADVSVRGPLQVSLRGNQQFDLVSLDAPALSDLVLGQLPRDPVRLRLRSRLTAREELSIRRTALRTVVGRNTRHEQVMATVQDGDSFRVGLPELTGELSVQAFIDGVSKPVRREGNTLILMLPGDREQHVIDLRVWLALQTPTSVSNIEPILRLPVGVGRVYWQIITPLDGHIVWASPTLGRSMMWRFDRWRLFRESSHDDQALTQFGGATENPLPPGNRYLYLGSDLRSFRVVVVSRVVLWLCIGAFVLTLAVILSNFPRSRNPMMAVAMAVLFGGLLAIAPDAAVLAGQFGIIAMVLVIVMIAVRALLSRSDSDRVFSSSPQLPVPISGQASSHHQKKPLLPNAGAQISTQTIPTSTSEASS